MAKNDLPEEHKITLPMYMRNKIKEHVDAEKSFDPTACITIGLLRLHSFWNHDTLLVDPISKGITDNDATVFLCRNKTPFGTCSLKLPERMTSSLLLPEIVVS